MNWTANLAAKLLVLAGDTLTREEEPRLRARCRICPPDGQGALALIASLGKGNGASRASMRSFNRSTARRKPSTSSRRLANSSRGYADLQYFKMPRAGEMALNANALTSSKPRTITL